MIIYLFSIPVICTRDVTTKQYNIYMKLIRLHYVSIVIFLFIVYIIDNSRQSILHKAIHIVNYILSSHRRQRKNQMVKN